MSPDELKAIMKAKNERDTQEFKRTWEQTRAVSFYSIVAMQGTKEFKKPEDLFKFSWEKEEEPRRLTKKEMIEKAINHGKGR